MLLTIVTIFAAFLFSYPFVIYPALLRALTRKRPRPAAPPDSSELPSVAMVICALNEQQMIGEKMKNCLDLDYPKDKLRIVVVSDGSTDDTVKIVESYASSGIELIEQKRRRGKVANLNSVLPTCSEDILVLSDANVLYRPDAILKLAARFQDPQVGCVSGKVVLQGTTDLLDAATEQYYSLEWTLQERASELYSMPGADGAMYALRRALFQRCPNDTLVEDFVIPMGIIAQGKRTVFEPGAIGWEPGVMSMSEEFRRKVRIAAGCAQALLRGNGWPRNAPASFWFIFVSHKLLRWMSPISAAVVVASCLANIASPLSKLMITGMTALSVLAGLRLVTSWEHPILTGPFYFVFAQVAVGVGLLKGITGRQSVLWAKANR